MGIEIRVEAKVVGQQTSLFDACTIQIDCPKSKNRLSLRGLITQLVNVEIAAFRERQEEGRLLHVMTRDELDTSRLQGKFDFGAHPVAFIDEQVALKTALQAFEDGLYFVFIDGEQCETLDDPVMLKANSELRLLRLIPLTGG